MADNRHSQTVGSTVEASGFIDPPAAGASNRLQSVSNTTPPRAFTFDASGRTTTDGLRTLVHDARGRLAQVTAAVGTTTFAINALGERVAKSGTFTPGGAKIIHYDPSGKMVSASVPGLDFWSDLVYLGDTPIAMLTGPATTPTINILQADHLDTVVSILNAAAVQIWRWGRDPYGSVVPNEDPDGDGNPVWFDLRFPGQYHDRETGLVYNYFRDYDPAIGRYWRGLNLYGYVGGNPLSYSDPFALLYPAGTPFPVPPEAAIAFGAPVAQVVQFPYLTPIPLLAQRAWDRYAADIDFACSNRCSQGQVLMCATLSTGTTAVGGVFGGLVSVPSGGAAAPMTVPVGTAAGWVFGQAACRAAMNCTERCRQSLSCPQ